MENKKTPSDFLKGVIGKPVVVKLNSGVEYRGSYEEPVPAGLPSFVLSQGF